MKIMIIILNVCVFINFSCAQQKYEKSPKFPPMKKERIEQVEKVEKTTYVINLGDLKLENNLYSWKIDNEYHILDGFTTIYSHYQTTGDDNPSLVPYIYAKGEFLEGKYHGKWLFYDKTGKIIKTEKWNKGLLISTKS